MTSLDLPELLVAIIIGGGIGIALALLIYVVIRVAL